jgi:hypothetical protein
MVSRRWSLTSTAAHPALQCGVQRKQPAHRSSRRQRSPIGRMVGARRSETSGRCWRGVLRESPAPHGENPERRRLGGKATPHICKSTWSRPQPEHRPRFTQILRARDAIVAVSATHQWVGHDSPTIATPANQFVAKNQRRTPQSAVSQKSGNVGAADPSNLDHNLLLPGPRFRPRTLLQFNLARSGIDRSLHRPKYKPAFVLSNITLVIFLTGLRGIPLVRTGIKNKVEISPRLIY